MSTFVIPDKPDSVYELVFSGQLKKSTDAQAYSTYSIVPASIVCAAIARLRAMPKIASLKAASIQKINTLLPTVNYQIKRHFQETGIVEVLEGEAAVTVHNLRGIYGAIAARFFCPSLAQFPRFLSQQLGHLIGDETIDNNLSHSTEHYFHYYLVAENGYKIEAMGIKLDEPMPVKSFVQLAEEFLMSDDPWCRLTGVIASTGQSPDDLLKHFVYKGVEGEHTILYTRLVHSTDTPYLQLITLGGATLVYEAIAQLKNHPELKPYLNTHTGKQINAYVRERIADHLGQLGVETYQLAIAQYNLLVKQLGLSNSVGQVRSPSNDTVDTEDKLDNKHASIRTVGWVRKEFDEIRSLLGTTNNNETLIEIINLAKLALSHQQKTVIPTVSTSPHPSLNELQSRIESAAQSDDVVNEDLGTLEPYTPDDAVAAASLPANDNQPTSSLISLLQIEDDEKQTSVEEKVTEPVKEEPASGTTFNDKNTTFSQQSLTETSTQIAVVNNNDLTTAITTLVNSMATLTQRFDRFLETADSPVVSTPVRNYPFSITQSPNTNTTVTQTNPRRPRRKSDKARERIHDAINALINYNGRVAYEQRWYISAPVLKALAGGAQVTINEAIKNLKPLLDEHHQALGLGTQHNRSFHQGEQVTDFLTGDF